MAPLTMKRRHLKTLQAVFAHPVSANIQWADAVALMNALGAEVVEREGSRVAFILKGRINIQHRPHPSPNMDKGAVADLRDFLKLCDIRP